MKEYETMVELSIGNTKCLDEWKNFLPSKTILSSYFKESLEIYVKSPIMHGKDYKRAKGTVKVFVGDPERWQDYQATMDIIRRIWVEVLKYLTQISNNSVALVYFAGLTRDQDLLSSVVRYLNFVQNENNRFFVSEICKEYQQSEPNGGRVCVEYSETFFRDFAGREGFEYYPGEMLITGIVIHEKEVKELLNADIMNRNVLEKIWQNKKVFSWWICDSDFEGIEIWHRDYSGSELLKKIKNDILSKTEYPLHIKED